MPASQPTESAAHEQRLKRVEYMVEAIFDGMTGGRSRGQAERTSRSAGIPWAGDLVGLPPPEQEGKVSPSASDTCRVLYAALPSQKDLSILFGTGRAAIYVQAICNSYSELFHEGKARPSSTLSVLPSVTAHPVVLARKLLQIALCIQQLDSSFDRTTLDLGGRDVHDARTFYVSLASSTVTCHHELLDSVEGLECLIYESVYLVNCGSLRRALVVLRGAATLAQLMGLHRRVVPLPPKQHDPATHASLHVVWAHIAFLERYVSLLLGMPTSITQTRFASKTKTADETHLQWMEKAQIDVFEHIIQRNIAGRYHDATTTRDIDQELNRMTHSVPEKWWVPMQLQPGMSEEEAMSAVIRAQSQIIHYNLLAVLHLPFLLRTGTDHHFDYNKSTCLYASREVLSRYIVFRSVVRVVFCCRPVDFCAFTAALALLLAHLDSHGSNPGHMLAHQRLSDRALIENVVGMLDELNELNHDELSRETAKLTRKLLELEEKCSQGGGTYRGRIPQEDEEGGVEVQQGPFQLDIPYFGTVKLAPEMAPVSQHTCVMSGSTLPSQGTRKVSMAGFASIPSMITSKPTRTALPNAVGESLAMTTDYNLPALQGEYDDSHHLHVSDQNPFFVCGPLAAFRPDIQSGYDTAMPDLMAGPDLWAFQGVDTVFFDSLIGGSVGDEFTWDNF